MRVQRAELTVGPRVARRLRGIEDHPLGDERAHRRVAVLVLGEREDDGAQHEREHDDAQAPRRRRRTGTGATRGRSAQPGASAARTRGSAASISGQRDGADRDAEPAAVLARPKA